MWRLIDSKVKNSLLKVPLRRYIGGFVYFPNMCVTTAFFIFANLEIVANFKYSV